MANAGLALSDLISVQTNLSPTAAPTQNFGLLLIMGSTPNVIDPVQRARPYSSLLQVAGDFGPTTPEYLSAQLVFAQSPQPAQVMIGKWAQAATAGLLHGGPITAALSAFTAITTGSFTITIDGTARTPATLNFSSQTNFNGVATVINTAISAWGTCTYNAVYNRFEIVSNTTGASSNVGFAGAPGSGVDISVLIAGTAAAGAQSVAGVIAESMLNGVIACAGASGAWYGLSVAIPSPTNSDIQAVAAFIEATGNRVFMVTTQDANSLVSTSTTDIGYLLKQSALNRTAVQYSSSSPYAACSMFARQASVDFTANNSTITLMYKQEPIVAAELLSETGAAALKAKSINAFVTYQVSGAPLTIIQYGTMASGQFIDTIVGTDWLNNDMQVGYFNALYTSSNKIPQTDPGVNILAGVIAASCSRGVNNGLIAPGVWTGPPIGNVKTNQNLPAGFYVYQPPISTQSQATRGARIAPTIQALIKLGGAIHTGAVLINVNQ